MKKAGLSAIDRFLERTRLLKAFWWRSAHCHDRVRARGEVAGGSQLAPYFLVGEGQQSARTVGIATASTGPGFDAANAFGSGAMRPQSSGSQIVPGV